MLALTREQELLWVCEWAHTVYQKLWLVPNMDCDPCLIINI